LRIRIFTTEDAEVTEAGEQGVFRIFDPNPSPFRALCVLCALCGSILPLLAKCFFT
jgi:hypothetical protein